MEYDGSPRVGDQPPGLVEQRVVDVEPADLDVDLEDLGAVGDPLADVRRRAWLGVERGRPQRLGHPVGEAGCPVVEELGHIGLVGVGKR